jgi:hypothetical protein
MFGFYWAITTLLDISYGKPSTGLAGIFCGDDPCGCRTFFSKEDCELAAMGDIPLKNSNLFHSTT